MSRRRRVDIDIPENLGMVLLAIYLILVGLTQLVTGFAIPPILLALLAIAAGILILIGR